jgi:hypothetical protein
MKQPGLAIAAGIVFVAVLAWRLIGHDAAPAAVAVEKVSTPIPALFEEPRAQPAQAPEVVQALPTPTPMPEAAPPADLQLPPAKSEPGKPPAGWGRGPNLEYATEIDNEVFYSGNGSLRISSLNGNLQGRGDGGQVTKADSYRGKRVQFSAIIRTENVSNGAALWFRVDGTDGRTLAFDNSQASDRKLQGNTDWTEVRLVLDVPENAGAMYYGVILAGRGRAWMDNARIAVVDERTPVTRAVVPPSVSLIHPVPGPRTPSTPRNLDFEQ